MPDENSSSLRPSRMTGNRVLDQKVALPPGWKPNGAAPSNSQEPPPPTDESLRVDAQKLQAIESGEPKLETFPLPTEPRPPKTSEPWYLKKQREEEEKAKNRRLPKVHYPKAPEDEAYAALAETKATTKGFGVDPTYYTGEAPRQWWKDQYLIAEESADRQWGFYFNPMGVFTLQYHMDLPSLNLAYSKETVALTSPGSKGPFINPVTGRRVRVNKQYPERGNFSRLQYELATETVIRTPYGTFLIFLEPYYITEDKDSGQLPFKVKDFGSRFLPSGRIQGFAKLENDEDPSRFDVSAYVRWAHDLNIMGQPIGVALYYERKAGGADANRETLLETWGQTLGAMLISKQFGFFINPELLWDSTKLDAERGYKIRGGVAVPFKTLFYMIGDMAEGKKPGGGEWWYKFGDALADPFDLDEHRMPIATTHILLNDASTTLLFLDYTKFENPRNPMLSEFREPSLFNLGSIGPGGPNGRNVDASSIGGGMTYRLAFRENPFPGEGKWDKFWNALLNLTEIQGGIQLAKYKISGNDIPLRTQLRGRGSFGYVLVNTPAEIQPQVDGWWWAASLQVSRKIPIDLNGKRYGYLGIGVFGDVRKILGEVTDNSISSDPIKTLGLVIDYSWKPRFLRTATRK